MRPTLVLRHGHRRLSLTEGAVAIGRLEECDVLLEGAEISRRHARIVATPQGPLLVDRSRFGTVLNGSLVVAPSVLQAGDVIQVGPYDLYVELGEATPAPADLGGFGRQLALWRRRYGLAELVGTVALILAALLVRKTTGLLVLAALAGSLAEAAWFYAVLLAREVRQERASARLGGFVPRPLRELGRDLLLEFGAAERVDCLLLRPLCLGLGLAGIGGWSGLLAGKIVADLLFYGPLLSLLHWRDANRNTLRAQAADPRRRETTASGLPVLRG
jgi:hypothetical protein